MCSWELRTGVPSDVATSLTTSFPEGGSYTFSLDLTAAVCVSHEYLLLALIPFELRF